MKHIKEYRPFVDKPPKIGEYFICHDDITENRLLKLFLANNIGKCVEVRQHTALYPYTLTYNNIPESILKDFNNGSLDFKNSRQFSLKEIVRYATPQEILEYDFYDAQEKYNL